jgi:hypothetical protein
MAMKKKGILYRLVFTIDGFRGTRYEDVFADGGETRLDMMAYFKRTHAKSHKLVSIGAKPIADSSVLFPKKTKTEGGQA